MKIIIMVMAACFAMLSVAAAAVGKYPVGKDPVGKYPQPVVSKG